MKTFLYRIFFLLIFGAFFLSVNSCASFYKPSKNKKEQQKIRKSEANKQDKVINRGL